MIDYFKFKEKTVVVALSPGSVVLFLPSNRVMARGQPAQDARQDGHSRAVPSTLSTVPSTLSTVPSTLSTVPSTLSTVPSTLSTAPSTLSTVPQVHSQSSALESLRK